MAEHGGEHPGREETPAAEHNDSGPEEGNTWYFSVNDDMDDDDDEDYEDAPDELEADIFEGMSPHPTLSKQRVLMPLDR